MDHVEPLIKTTPHQPTFYIKKNYIYSKNPDGKVGCSITLKLRGGLLKNKICSNSSLVGGVRCN
jgi:hypothetical protein